jgi:hypothetical protein
MWTAWLMGKSESGSMVECSVEFRPDAATDPEMVARTETITLDPIADGITNAATATLKLREKVSVILDRLNKVDQLGDLVETNIGVQIQPLPLQQVAAAVPAPGSQIPRTESGR